MIRRCEFAETTLPVSLILFAFALVNYLSLMYYSAITVVDIDTLLFMTRLRFLLTSCLILVAFLLLNLKFKPTESKELRVILGAMAVMVIGVWYTIVLREVSFTDISLARIILTE